MSDHTKRELDNLSFPDKDFYNRVWDILVEHAGASDRDLDRLCFLVSYKPQKFPTHEYRFQGDLGFGGKFWVSREGCRINCYREDEDPERTATIKKVNALLAELTREMKPDFSRF